ncbi:MAG: FKBP-type peptidyl-prolyl cis-trans isomerase [Clostridia bacterium]|nr:FKBP-type peptidyl-prolyl cis-trans isomerase [Clostridia bacterium]
MKRLTAILLITVLMMTFLTGCGKNRELYNNVDLADYVEVGDYLGIEIDTASNNYIKLYSYYLYMDTHNYKIEDDAIKEVTTFDTSAEAVVELGDMVNIDYTGYKDEVAFDGGSAQGGLLIIGSGTFIDDFEDQLIGAKVGETVEVNVTFPENYGSTQLAGADAKFVVTINGIAKNPEQIYSLFGLESQEDYAEILGSRAQKSLLFDIIGDSSTIKDFPEKDVEKFYEAAVEYYPATYGVDIASEDKDTVLKELIYPTMKENMIMYYIFDKEELELYESTVESQGVNNAVIAESYAVNEIVLEYLLDNAVIK